MHSSRSIDQSLKSFQVGNLASGINGCPGSSSSAASKETKISLESASSSGYHVKILLDHIALRGYFLVKEEWINIQEPAVIQACSSSIDLRTAIVKRKVTSMANLHRFAQNIAILINISRVLAPRPSATAGIRKNLPLIPPELNNLPDQTLRWITLHLTLSRNGEAAKFFQARSDVAVGLFFRIVAVFVL
jgi:hypothetical protein